MQALTPYLIGFAAMSCYAALSSIAKKTLPEIPSLTFVAVTSGLLSLVATCCAFFFDKGFSLTSLKMNTWGGLFVFSAVNFVGFALYMTTIKRIPVAEYQMIYIFSPIIAAFFALLLLGEPFKMRYLAGLAVMGLGLFIALYDSAKS